MQDMKTEHLNMQYDVKWSHTPGSIDQEWQPPLHIRTSFRVGIPRKVAGEGGQSSGGTGWVGSSLAAVGRQGCEGEQHQTQHSDVPA